MTQANMGHGLFGALDSSFWIAGGVKTELFSLQYGTMRSSVSHSLTAIQEARKT